MSLNSLPEVEYLKMTESLGIFFIWALFFFFFKFDFLKFELEIYEITRKKIENTSYSSKPEHKKVLGFFFSLSFVSWD